MTRFWLLRLAPVLLASLLLAAPGGATAAELAGSARSTRVTPRLELGAKAVCAGAESREPGRVFATTALTPPGRWRDSLHAAVVDVASPEPRARGERCVVARQPPARAPPPLS